jgi:hypothetical protein
MNTYLVALLAALAVFASASNADTTVKLSDLEAAGVKITSITLESVQPSVCANPQYDVSDTNRDGTFNRICVGLKYDPCNEDGVAIAYSAWQEAGKVCKDRVCAKPDEIVAGPVPAC